MDWLSQNWIWIVVAVVFFAAHLFGHGGHGGHGGARGDGRRDGNSGGGASRRPGGSGHAH